MTSTTDQFRRVTADEVTIGDRIARTRTADFEEVAHVQPGPVAVRFLNANKQTIMRPRKTAKLWVKLRLYRVAAAGLPGDEDVELGQVHAISPRDAEYVATHNGTVDSPDIAFYVEEVQEG